MFRHFFLKNNLQRSINPHDESLICEVESASREDVDRAVEAAEAAFYQGEWGKMSARDRAAALNRLADLMEEHKEELVSFNYFFVVMGEVCST